MRIRRRDKEAHPSPKPNDTSSSPAHQGPTSMDPVKSLIAEPTESEPPPEATPPATPAPATAPPASEPVPAVAAEAPVAEPRVSSPTPAPEPEADMADARRLEEHDAPRQHRRQTARPPTPCVRPRSARTPTNS